MHPKSASKQNSENAKLLTNAWSWICNRSLLWHARAPTFLECSQMWVWPQVPLGRPSPLHTSLGRPLPEHCKKHQGVLGEKRRGGWGGRGLWLEGRVLQLQGGLVGIFQRAVGAGPTSGGSRFPRNLNSWYFYGYASTGHIWPRQGGRYLQIQAALSTIFWMWVSIFTYGSVFLRSRLVFVVYGNLFFVEIRLGLCCLQWKIGSFLFTSGSPCPDLFFLRKLKNNSTSSKKMHPEMFSSVLRGLLGTGPPRPHPQICLALPSSWVDLASNRGKSGNRFQINVKSMLSRCQIDPRGGESDAQPVGWPDITSLCVLFRIQETQTVFSWLTSWLSRGQPVFQ